MNEKMNVLDVQLDNCTAKDAMKIIAEYMQTEELNTVDIVTVDTLMRATQLDGMKEELEKLDLLLPGDMAILEAAKITDRKRIQEMEDQTMLKMVFHYFHKNRCKIFILAGSEEEGDRLQGYLHEAYSGIQVVGMKAVPADESEDDRITNLVNGGRHAGQRHQRRRSRLCDCQHGFPLAGTVCLPVQRAAEYQNVVWNRT